MRRTWSVTWTSSQRGALAAAVNGPGGWQVVSADQVAGDGLDQRHAIALMMRTAIYAAGRSTFSLLTS
ncbi:hypothetical protein [Micromonospora sp. NPDC050695]|uniref:hypothetical protein n=1 Tax=Micromonospora sp. NPDC050695 TaxID=3154938 RepID=UPI0033C45076